MSVTELDIQSFYSPELKTTGIVESDDQITIHIHSMSQEATCHKCGAPLIKHHGMHRRIVQDLLILGKRLIGYTSAIEMMLRIQFQHRTSCKDSLIPFRKEFSQILIGKMFSTSVRSVSKALVSSNAS